MSTGPCKCHLYEQNGDPPVVPTRGEPTLHRIDEVRKQQNVSARTLAARMQTTIDEIERQQKPNCDLLLSELYRWQSALEVPVGELLKEPGPELSPHIRRRAMLVKVMKTVRSLQRNEDAEAVDLLLARLVEQLVEVMPELATVDSWPIVGKRRSAEDVSGTEQKMLPESIFDGHYPQHMDQE